MTEIGPFLNWNFLPFLRISTSRTNRYSVKRDVKAVLLLKVNLPSAGPDFTFFFGFVGFLLTHRVHFSWRGLFGAFGLIGGPWMMPPWSGTVDRPFLFTLLMT